MYISLYDIYICTFVCLSLFAEITDYQIIPSGELLFSINNVILTKSKTF